MTEKPNGRLAPAADRHPAGIEPAETRIAFYPRPYPLALLTQPRIAFHRSCEMSTARYLAALLAATLFAACCHPTTVRVPVVVAPPPCLTELAPTPPAGEDDAAWSAYHARIEEWAARVEASCGGHLRTEED